MSGDWETRESYGNITTLGIMQELYKNFLITTFYCWKIRLIVYGRLCVGRGGAAKAGGGAAGSQRQAGQKQAEAAGWAGGLQHWPGDPASQGAGAGEEAEKLRQGSGRREGEYLI